MLKSARPPRSHDATSQAPHTAPLVGRSAGGHLMHWQWSLSSSGSVFGVEGSRVIVKGCTELSRGSRGGSFSRNRAPKLLRATRLGRGFRALMLCVVSRRSDIILPCGTVHAMPRCAGVPGPAPPLICMCETPDSPRRSTPRQPQSEHTCRRARLVHLDGRGDTARSWQRISDNHLRPQPAFPYNTTPRRRGRRDGA